MTKRLIIFAREAVPGRVKTRLARQIGDDAAARLYEVMVADVVAMAATLEEVRPVVFWALETDVMPQVPGFPRMESAQQQGEGLGARMEHAFQRTFAAGSDICCIIGSDSPDLPAEYVREAFGILERNEADVVFGPSDDGGYYLLGMRRLWRELFQDMPWGGNQVLQASLTRAREHDLRTSLLPAWYDIDTAADARRLARSSNAAACRTRTMLLMSDFTLQEG